MKNRNPFFQKNEKYFILINSYFILCNPCLTYGKKERNFDIALLDQIHKFCISVPDNFILFHTFYQNINPVPFNGLAITAKSE